MLPQLGLNPSNYNSAACSFGCFEIPYGSSCIHRGITERVKLISSFEVVNQALKNFD